MTFPTRNTAYVSNQTPHYNICYITFRYLCLFPIFSIHSVSTCISLVIRASIAFVVTLKLFKWYRKLRLSEIELPCCHHCDVKKEFHTVYPLTFLSYNVSYSAVVINKSNIIPSLQKVKYFTLENDYENHLFVSCSMNS